MSVCMYERDKILKRTTHATALLKADFDRDHKKSTKRRDATRRPAIYLSRQLFGASGAQQQYLQE